MNPSRESVSLTITGDTASLLTVFITALTRKILASPRVERKYGCHDVEQSDV